MSKKNLLNEATIRRFMKLADMEPLTNPFVDRLEEMHCPSGDRDDDMDPMEEDKAFTAKKEKPGADLRRGAEKRGAEGTLAKTPGHGKDDFVNEDEEPMDEMHCPSGGRDDDEPGARDYMEEADDAEKLDATERELSDMDAEADRERDEMDAMEDGDIPADVRDRIEDALASALEDLADKLDLDLDVERDDDAAPEMDAAPEAEVAVDVDDDDDAVEVDAMLENVEVVDDADLINEVAKRVTARLVKAMAKK